MFNAIGEKSADFSAFDHIFLFFIFVGIDFLFLLVPGIVCVVVALPVLCI